MPEAVKPAAIWALEAAWRSRPSGYPEQFQPVVKGREKRADVLILEVGDRTPGDEASYPDDDIRAEMIEGNRYRFTRKDGTPF